ncbi:hypothetical protein T484DRAFT_1843063, partial [Baffinella frigidus]
MAMGGYRITFSLAWQCFSIDEIRGLSIDEIRVRIVGAQGTMVAIAFTRPGGDQFQ